MGCVSTKKQLDVRMRTDVPTIITKKPEQQGIPSSPPQLERIEEAEAEQTTEPVKRQERYRISGSIAETDKQDEMQQKYDKIDREPRPN